jgi:hypothetical protein
MHVRLSFVLVFCCVLIWMNSTVGFSLAAHKRREQVSEKSDGACASGQLAKSGSWMSHKSEMCKLCFANVDDKPDYPTVTLYSVGNIRPICCFKILTYAQESYFFHCTSLRTYTVTLLYNFTNHQLIANIYETHQHKKLHYVLLTNRKLMTSRVFQLRKDPS